MTKVEMFDKFRRLVTRDIPVMPPPVASKPPEQDTKAALKDWLQDERSRHLLSWLDTQIEAAESQRNLAFKDHASIVIAVGFENGLKAVRKHLTSLKE